MNQLQSAEETVNGASNWKQVYSYDRYGNRSLTTGTTLPAQLDATNNPTISTANNRITSTGYSYDSAGNLLCDPAHACSQTPQFTPYYSYDAENKLTSAGSSPSVGGSSYSYDGEGRRVEKVAGAVATVYVYDAGGRMVAEYGGAQSQMSGASYVMQDALGSTRVVTGQGQEVRGRYDYLPFGEEVYAGREGYGGEDVRQRFTGYERDEETGLEYAKARYYSSTAGRYTSVDPIVVTPERFFDPQQFNLYSYTRNNPLRFIDPTGEKLVISGDINEIKKQLADILGTEDAAKRITFDEKTGVVKVDLTGIDLTKNEGASLLNDAISSQKVYGLSVGSSVETLGGQLSLIPTKDKHSTMENLDNNPDSRYSKGKTDMQKPPKGVDDQVGINYDFRNKNSKSNTNLPQAPNFTVTFHELAEAFAKVEHGKQYDEAHQEAIDREKRLREQRPYLKGYNPGSGPGTTIIIKNK